MFGPEAQAYKRGYDAATRQHRAAIGDGITAPVMEWIGRRIAAVHADWVLEESADLVGAASVTPFLSHRDTGDEQ